MILKYDSKLEQYLIGRAEDAINYLQYKIKNAPTNKDAAFARSFVCSSLDEAIYMIHIGTVAETGLSPLAEKKFSELEIELGKLIRELPTIRYAKKISRPIKMRKSLQIAGL